MEKLWYASYGSNLLQQRFMAYLRGGVVPGSSRRQIGCRDSTPPARDHGVMILHRLIFAGASSRWEGGVAFLSCHRDSAAKTLGRMYLISSDQFEDLVLQENGHPHLGIDLGIDLEMTIRNGRSTLEKGLYSTILHLGQEGGYPIFTFTGPCGEGKVPPARPGPRCLSVMAQGLKEVYGLSQEGIVDYLKGVPGVQGFMAEKELSRIVGEVIPPYPSSFT